MHDWSLLNARLALTVAIGLGLGAVLPMHAAAAARTDVAATASTANSTAPAPDPVTRSFRALLADQWEWQRREFPEAATASGDYRFNDRLTDLSAAAVAARKAHDRSVLQRFEQIDGARLQGQDRISYAVFGTMARQAVQFDTLYGDLPFGAADNWLPLSPMFGPQSSLPSLVLQTPFATVADYDHYLARLAAVPRQIDQIIARMQAGLDSGWMPSAAAMQKVPGQLAAQMEGDPLRSLMYQPFAKIPAGLGDAQQQRLTQAGRQAITDQVMPAFRMLHQFVVTTYLPACRTSLAASTLPGGAPYYQLVVAAQTTTTMTPAEIHQLGLREVARIDAEMEKVIARIGFRGTRAEFVKFTNTDPQFLFTSSAQMLAAYRDIAKRADAELPRLFAELPRTPYGIRAMQAYEGDNAEHYSQGALDGSRAGYFEANVLNLARRSSPSMTALLLHEAVPGHHLQIARQHELNNLPDFRRNAWFTAFGEGWALYAESLGEEMGMYQDPYAKFGQLSGEMHRACRLVIDTGIHAFGWTREQSIAYLETNAALSNAFASAEVDRYIV
ncbi:MAG: DUF885 domain-containing protein, partial [Pseudomonadota bacterium]|nr:DUF885 domain-containing protein [Pseudomonadota bacterium]